ncbi:MAG: hypothetical protein QF595_02540 [Dehalococcoidia bacterium]|mgnify:FL=1|jgi:hypothetical protein|nr:hypothetical protein [Dehalococcoidia bacterium]|tara:strand:- start:1743 stop:2066 length:324 start_codon:yes stop_codon:yes gene_type:complete
MARKWLLDQFGYRTNHFFEEPDGSITIDTVQDVAPILEDNKRKFNAFGKKNTPGKRHETFHHSHRIPVNVYELWWRETNGAIEDPKVLAKYLNDPDNQYFQVAPTTL